MLSFDKSYCQSVGGILKLNCLLCSFLGIICILFTPVQISNVRGTSFIVINILGILCTTFVLMTQIFQIWQRHFYQFDYVRFEMFLHGFLACAYFIVSGITLSLDVVGYSVAAFFGLLGFCFYLYDAYIGYIFSRRVNVSTQTQNI